MITIDAPISFVLGSGLALMAQPETWPTVRSRGYLLQTLVLTPVIAFFMMRFPDWEWNYMFGAEAFFFGEGNTGGIVVFVVMLALMNASYMFGFHYAARLVHRGHREKAMRMVFGMLALIATIIVVMWRQTLYVGTISEFEAGTANLIFTEPAFLVAQGLAGTLLTLGTLWALRPQTSSTGGQRLQAG